MKKQLLVSLIFATLAMSANAQTEMDSFRNEMLQGFSSFRSEVLTNYESFRQKVNAEYAEFMREVWTEFQRFKGEPIPENEVPPVPVVPYEDKDKDQGQGQIPRKDRELEAEPITPPLPNPEPQPEPIEPIKSNPIVAPTPLYLSAEFYGTQIRVRLSDNARFHLTSVNENDVANCWEKLSSGQYDALLEDCLTNRTAYHLCDWAYLGMLQTICNQFLGHETNESILLASWLYCQSGYKMRLASSGNKLEMLYASKHRIYEHSYFKIDQERFYPLHENEYNLKIFNHAFANEKAMSLIIDRKQNFALTKTSTRELLSERYPDMKVSVSTNKNAIDFYSSYPSSEINGNFMTRWALYANTPLCENTVKELYPALRSTIAGCTELDAANRLLNWVQTAFEYEYDDKVWGKDRAFFAEETLYYPYCDCEDRSILFSRLVRDLLDLDVVLVYYPGHLATAVHFRQDVAGDYINVNGKKFVVADPTFINAPVGRTMPRMDNGTAKVIRVY